MSGGLRKRQSGRISIHPRRSCERRPKMLSLTPLALLFQSTPLLRAATHRRKNRRGLQRVSIHAALASGDSLWRFLRYLQICFNPRRSCERRPVTAFLRVWSWLFQSTPLLRAATNNRLYVLVVELVSIHAALASGDLAQIGALPNTIVSIHAALASGDHIRRFNVGHLRVSIHAALASGDISSGPDFRPRNCFNPRRSCERRRRGQ